MGASWISCIHITKHMPINCVESGPGFIKRTGLRPYKWKWNFLSCLICIHRVPCTQNFSMSKRMAIPKACLFSWTHLKSFPITLISYSNHVSCSLIFTELVTHIFIALTLVVFFVFFTESLNALEDKDLDALMADLVADINEVEQRTLQAQKTSGNQQSVVTQPSTGTNNDFCSKLSPCATITGQFKNDLPPPPPAPDLDLPPPPPPPPPEPLSQVSLRGISFQEFSNL